ncbi:unannotated protein [freshwater metagenome]|uniref:Unannotated protein n=1 Tax=freshwater metagenome TaxID=449393 RepID=A0A6J6FHU7_9ZZZZ
MNTAPPAMEMFFMKPIMSACLACGSSMAQKLCIFTAMITRMAAKTMAPRSAHTPRITDRPPRSSTTPEP